MLATAAILQTGFQVFSGISAYNQSKADEAQQKINADIAETRALQNDTMMRQELERVQGTIKASRSLGPASDLSPTAQLFLQGADDEISRDRMRRVASEKQRAEDFRAAGRGAKARGRLSLVSGVVNGGFSLARGINAGAFSF